MKKTFCVEDGETLVIETYDNMKAITNRDATEAEIFFQDKINRLKEKITELGGLNENIR